MEPPRPRRTPGPPTWHFEFGDRGITVNATDVADTVAFLASPDARHVTTQVIHVNGGAFRGR